MNDDKKEDRPDNGDHGKNFVTITVGIKDVQIHRGSQSVSAIKDAGGVPPADALEQVVDDRLTPLADGDSVTIKGGEKFVSHPRDSGSASN
jgi:hypothetical protein